MARLGAGTALALLLAGSYPASSATPEAEVKAAYLLKLAAFVRWPEALPADAPFSICIAGRGDIADVLTMLVREQQVDGRRVSVSRLAASQAAQAKDCRVLYLGRGAATAQTLLAASNSAAVLTVSDRNGGTRGGVIEFVLRDGRVRFTVNRTRAGARKLELSARLLEVAAAVAP